MRISLHAKVHGVRTEDKYRTILAPHVCFLNLRPQSCILRHRKCNNRRVEPVNLVRVLDHNSTGREPPLGLLFPTSVPEQPEQPAASSKCHRGGGPTRAILPSGTPEDEPMRPGTSLSRPGLVALGPLRGLLAACTACWPPLHAIRRRRRPVNRRALARLLSARR